VPKYNYVGEIDVEYATYNFHVQKHVVRGLVEFTPIFNSSTFIKQLFANLLLPKNTKTQTVRGEKLQMIVLLEKDAICKILMKLIPVELFRRIRRFQFRFLSSQNYTEK